MSDRIRILYIDDYDLDRELVRDALEKEHGGFQLTEAGNRHEFEALLKNQEFDLVLSDFNIAGFEGLQVLDIVHAHDPRMPVIIVTGTGSEEIAVSAMKQGAADYVIKRPNHIRKLPHTILAAIERKTLKELSEKAELAVKESKEEYRKILDNILVGVYQVSIDGKFQFANQKLVEMLGYSSYEELKSSASIADLYIRPEERSKNVDEILQKGFIIGEFEFRRKDGQSIWVRLNTRTTTSKEGSIIFEGLMEDVTDFKKLEEQLQQAQKMEAIATLAGGIAHDFNNILTIIIGNALMTLMEPDITSTVREGIEEIRKAAERASDFTRQLLAFGRRQIITPRILNLNELLEDLDKMLRRLLGENIELLIAQGDALWPVKTDPGQMEQVIINLIINARDALPTGGKVIIETANVDLSDNYFRRHGLEGWQPGPYVMLAVSDNGIGMDQETQTHIFEPFFTTKSKTKGTGLGLSTIYGIIKQNKGFIWVYSELEHGSTFKIYFPIGTADEVPGKQKDILPASLRGSETILIVEDESALRKCVRTALAEKGYKILEAENGKDALKISKAHDGLVDLIITDVVMPEMNGKEVVEKMLLLYPQIKVIYMSGYTNNAIVENSVLLPGLNFIEKPFTLEELSLKIRRVLNAE